MKVTAHWTPALKKDVGGHLKIIQKGGRKISLTLPKPVIEGLGWTHNLRLKPTKSGINRKVELPLELSVDPIKGTIILSNPKVAPVGFMGYHFNLQEMKYIRNKKKYLRELKLSPDARKLRYGAEFKEMWKGVKEWWETPEGRKRAKECAEGSPKLDAVRKEILKFHSQKKSKKQPKTTRRTLT